MDGREVLETALLFAGVISEVAIGAPGHIDAVHMMRIQPYTIEAVQVGDVLPSQLALEGLLAAIGKKYDAAGNLVDISVCSPTYTIVSGDTLGGIKAKERYQESIPALASENSIAGPDYIIYPKERITGTCPDTQAKGNTLTWTEVLLIGGCAAGGILYASRKFGSKKNK
jgi:hypothetical protein